MRRVIGVSSALLLAGVVAAGSAWAQEAGPVSGLGVSPGVSGAAQESVLGVQAAQLPRTGGLDAALLAPVGLAAAAVGLGLRARSRR